MGVIKTIIRRVIISAIRDTANNIKRMDAAGLPGEQFLDREGFQHYGFSSNPIDAQAEGIMIGIGNVFYLIAEDDRRYRIVMEKGEVALYTDEGDKIHLKRNKIIEITGQEKVIVNTKVAEINATTSAKIVSPVVELADGTQRKLTDERIVDAINQHTHPTAGTGPPSTPTTPLVLANVATAKTKAS